MTKNEKISAEKKVDEFQQQVLDLESKTKKIEEEKIQAIQEALEIDAKLTQVTSELNKIKEENKTIKNNAETESKLK